MVQLEPRYERLLNHMADQTPSPRTDGLRRTGNVDGIGRSCALFCLCLKPMDCSIPWASYERALSSSDELSLLLGW